ncbi:MAG: SDR family oxidoreductase [Anaerolineae bacterium]|nr:SDR family oxidoreductase [Anaerolineae bacterium]MCX8068660.1 SDR family oxidoreductase [Anaerolineae bacterium]MDW7991496.1 SDR family oxidoreductase [Anaerolineae bacterium]
MEDFSLHGKVALITGASRGIGRAIALRLARAGAKVVVCSRKMENVAPVAEEIRAGGGEALAVEAHVGQREQVETMVARALETFGRIDIAVNNAATNPHFGPILTADEGQWDKILDTNVKGAFRVAKAVVPHMQAQGGGKIINIASVAGLRPSPAMGVYSVSKAALIMLTQVLAVELAPANIQVNAIAPGVIKTRFSQVLWQTPALAEQILKGTPAGRFGEPEDVAGLALFLASPASDYVTGAVFVVDGGMNVASVL